MAFFSCLCSPLKKKNKRVKIRTVDDHIKDHGESSPESGDRKLAAASLSFNALTGRPGTGSFRFSCSSRVMDHESQLAVPDSDQKILSLSSDSDHSQKNRPKSSVTDEENDAVNKSSNRKQELDEKCEPEPEPEPHFWGSSMLKRSCSDLDQTRMQRVRIPISKSKSYGNIQRLNQEEANNNGQVEDPMSPVSVNSADKVILKKHSSAHILPSKSRRLWWNLYLWSHRNLYKTRLGKTHPVEETKQLPSINQFGGYSSDSAKPTKMRCPHDNSMGKGRCDGDCGGSSLWTERQWVAVPAISSPLSRVTEWVHESCILPQDEIVSAEEDDGVVVDLPSPSEKGPSPAIESSSQSHQNQPANITPEEISHANTFIQSLNSSSNVAHISGVGLRVIPTISHFSSLRAVNLSGNFIVNIAPGSLPKGLHVLDLSKNKINTIEGLRELTRLRVLNLSYNRISRIGQGLSSCTMIKELNLAGNKISLVEGMHRLLKLTVLDLSFNKITAAKALGQLVANYNSLLALNLLGNPLQNNINNIQLQKIVCGLLPKLALLNKQPVNPQKAREIREDANAKGALGNNIWNSKHKKSSKRVLQSQGGSSMHVRKPSKRSAQKMKQRSKSEVHHDHSLSSPRLDV